MVRYTIPKMAVLERLTDTNVRRTLNNDPNFEQLRYLVVLVASSEPPFHRGGVIADGNVTFSVKQLWRVANHFGLEFERFRGARRVFQYLERAQLVGAVRNERTQSHEYYYPTKQGITEAELSLDRLSKILLLESQAKTMQMAIRRQLRSLPTPVLEISLESKKMLHIGRDHDNDLSVDDPYMSSKHASVSRALEAWIFKDLNSKNGSWKIQPHELKRVTEDKISDGDMYQLGSTVFRFRVGTRM